MAEQSKIRTCLWFEKDGKEAAEFYVSLLPDSHIETAFTPQESGPPLIVEITLAGAPYMVLNGGPQFKHSPAASISVLTKDQNETDRLWSALIADGGEESMCAWLVDRFGVSWQIIPERLPQLLQAEDKAAAARTQQAMMKMRKIDIAALEAAFEG